MTVRRMLLAAASAWLVLHAALAVAFGDVRLPPALLAVVFAVAALTAAVALAPLYREAPRRIPPGVGTGLAVGCVAVTAATVPFLSARGLLGWGNWPMRSMTVVVAALAFRCFALGATAAVLGMCAVNAAAVWSLRGTDPSLSPDAAILMAVPPVTWLLLTLALRALVDRSLTATETYRQRHLDTEAAALVGQAVEETEETRREDVRTRVLPLLTRLAEGDGPLTPADRTEAAAMATFLRDDLKARWLLTAAVREDLAAARLRGVRVAVSCEPTAGASDETLVAASRQVLQALLGTVPAGATLTCRVTSSGPAAVFAMRGAASADVHAAADLLHQVAGAFAAVRVTMEDGDDGLLVELGLTRDRSGA